MASARCLVGREGSPGRRHLVGVLLDVATTVVGEAQEPTTVDLAPLDESLVLELLDGGVDRAGAGLPRAPGALGDLLDELVAVHLVAREDVEDGGADVTAARPGAPLTRWPLLRSEARPAEGPDEVVDPRGRAGPTAPHAAPGPALEAAPAAEAGHPVGAVSTATASTATGPAVSTGSTVSARSAGSAMAAGTARGPS